ncbi:YetF domain-containing protein, partial [uncultured Anoxybacillus sp.]
EKGKKKTPSLALPLIKDGVIQEEHLTLIDQTPTWLIKQLKKRGYERIENISYCTYENGTFYIDEKDE